MKKPAFKVQPFSKEELVCLEKTFLNSKGYINNTAGDFNRLRDLYILKIAIHLGTRPAETLCLKWSAIDWNKNEIDINPYTNKERGTEPIILSKKAKELLLSWRDIFENYLKSDFVFPCLSTFEPMSTSGYGKILGRICKEAGIQKVLWYTSAGQPIYNKRFYSTRKTFGTNLYRNSKDPYLTARALRHKGLSHIGSYIDLSGNELKKEIDRYF